MTALWLLAVVGITVLVAWLLVTEERPVLFPEPTKPTLAEALAAMTVGVQRLQVQIVTTLVPAMRKATEAAQAFAVSFAKAYNGEVERLRDDLQRLNDQRR